MMVWLADHVFSSFILNFETNIKILSSINWRVQEHTNVWLFIVKLKSTKMAYPNMNLRELSQCTNQLILALLLAILLIISPTNADDDKYYGAFVGNFVDRFHGIKGEVRIIIVLKYSKYIQLSLS